MQADFADIILASASSARASILANAGISFQQQSSALDEAAEHEKHGASLGPAKLATHLAEQKARLVLAKEPNAVVIGADQVLAVGDTILRKPENTDAARAQLVELRGQRHTLHSAVAVLYKDRTARFLDHATLTMRSFTDEFLDWYLDTAGPAVLTSVGAYHLEGLGIHLFEKVEGDYYTILGLPIVPVLDELRRLGMVMN
jgi:septum formation protein